LGKETLDRLEAAVATGDDPGVIPNMTLERFLHLCEICYDSSPYDWIKPAMSPRQKYQAMADGRHDGMLDVEPADDPNAFRTWYEARHAGGHPWEIRRGGNSTHIDLQVVPEERGWRLYLAGFSAARCVETARMAAALHAQGVPVAVVHGPDLVRMVRGEDSIGVVPDHVHPRYCHDLFPAEDRVYDFVHLAVLEELGDRATSLVYWYPISVPRPVG
jgi:hypothetical protein